MNKKKLILIGGGGHCRSCIEVIESTMDFEIKGIIDNALPVDSDLLGYKVLGGDEKIPHYLNEHSFCISIGQIKTADNRKNIIERILGLGGTLPNIVASTAWVSKHVQLGIGNMVMHGVFINAGVIIGDHNIINTRCLIEHDSRIGNYNHISTASVINGGCMVGNENFLGSRTVLSSGVNIVNKIVIGAGAVVSKNIVEAGTYVGMPAKKIQHA